jgi:hypothetical protein
LERGGRHGKPGPSHQESIAGIGNRHDGIPVADVTAYRTTTDQFPYFAPTPWIFNETGGNGTAVADSYYLQLEPLPAGIHTIHYDGTFIIPAGVLGHKAVTIPKDVTLLITMGS